MKSLETATGRMGRALLADLPTLEKAALTSVTVGWRWLIADVIDANGVHRAGLANRCGGPDQPRPTMWPHDARNAIGLLGDPDPLRAAVGLATINALLAPPPDQLHHIDGADWLAEAGRGRRVAAIGRFRQINGLTRVTLVHPTTQP